MQKSRISERRYDYRSKRYKCFFKSDIETALKDSKVGDTVTFTVTRRGKTANLKLTLAEYSPSGSSSTGNSNTQNKSSQSQGKSSDNSDSDSIWNYMFGQ